MKNVYRINDMTYSCLPIRTKEQSNRLSLGKDFRIVITNIDVNIWSNFGLVLHRVYTKVGSSGRIR